MDIYDIGLYVGYFLVIIGIIAAVLLPLINSLSDPKSLVRSGLALLALLVVFGIAYAMSDNDVAARFVGDPFNITPGLSQIIGGLLISTYFLFVIALVSIFIGELYKAVR